MAAIFELLLPEIIAIFALREQSWTMGKSHSKSQTKCKNKSGKKIKSTSEVGVNRFPHRQEVMKFMSMQHPCRN